MLVVAGEALIDLIVAPDGTVHARPGGGPFNAARTAARLGADCGFLGRFSTDRFGDQLLATLRQDGVADLIDRRTNAPTTLAVAEVDVDGAASYRFYLEGTSAPDLRPNHLPANLTAMAALHVGSLGLVLEPLASSVADLMRSVTDDVLVLVDLNCRPAAVADHDGYRSRLRTMLTRADVVKASTEDLAFLEPDRPPIEVAHDLLGAGTATVLLTAGSDGSHVIHRAGSTQLPIRRVAVADTVGAGDAFGAAFVAWLLRHGLGRAELADQDAVNRAAAAAAEVATDTCTRPGADPPWAKDLTFGDW